jgi:hypothetical protein
MLGENLLNFFDTTTILRETLLITTLLTSLKNAKLFIIDFTYN